MKLISLSSGSSGNCYLVRGDDGQNLLIDCGLTAKKIQQYLGELGVAIEGLDAIFLTHDHGDHLRGAGAISRKWGIPVYANPKTLAAAFPRWEKISRLEEERARMFGTAREVSGAKYNSRPFPTGAVASFGELEVSSFPVSHDAADTVCYTVREKGRQATILTDLGCGTDPIFEPLCHSDLIILEANHDLARLKASGYPFSLKARITSDHGHLSNNQAASILLKVIELSSTAHTVWLAHLSEENNHPEIARKEITNHLEMHGLARFPLQIALRDKPSLHWNGEPQFQQLQMF